jgi:hypothetical protein
MIAGTVVDPVPCFVRDEAVFLEGCHWLVARNGVTVLQHVLDSCILQVLNGSEHR